MIQKKFDPKKERLSLKISFVISMAALILLVCFWGYFAGKAITQKSYAQSIMCYIALGLNLSSIRRIIRSYNESMCSIEMTERILRLDGLKEKINNKKD